MAVPARQEALEMTIEDIELEDADLSIVHVLGSLVGAPRYEAAFSDGVVILLGATPRPELLDEGLAGDIVNRV